MAKRLLLLLAVLAVVGVCAGPWFYRTQMEGLPAPMLSLPTTHRPASTNLDGKWVVSAGPDDEAKRTQAGYRARQKLLWETVIVTGRTNSVRGDATVTGGNLQAASFVVDVGTMQSAHRGRDDKFRSTDVMDAAQFPTAKLAVLDPVNLSAVSGDGTPTTLEVSAQLTLKASAGRWRCGWTCSGRVAAWSPWAKSPSPSPITGSHRRRRRPVCSLSIRSSPSNSW